ncbi:MAG TPA: hypothetical protein VJZ76_11120 [Thermoanaerobaculia bacterium]|nr:hypothetical protein [Thermoanaerobaculia bacterium]
MIRRFLVVVCSLALAGTAVAQDTGDLERRLRALQDKVNEVEELKREIDVLSKEIEALKTGQQKQTVEVTPALSGRQYGLGAAASKVYRSEPGFSIGGYGDMVYANRRGGESTADLVRAVLYTGYKFNNNVLVNSELEVEHASTELGGAVSMEFAYLDFLMKPQANVRAGVVLMPVGFINEQHEPTAYFGAQRPVVERVIIPTTWSEIGAGLFGDVGRVSYRTYLTTGMDSSRFEAEEGLHEGKQAGAEAKAEDFAFVARADWHPIEGTLLGGAFYTGNSGQGRGFGGRVKLAEVHAESKFRAVSLRALAARASIGDAAAINAANGLVGDESVGRTLGGWYVEGGYDLGTGNVAFIPYARYERFDTQRSVPLGFERNPENDARVLTLGIEVKPIPQTVIKADWQQRKNRNQFNLGLGYIF